MVSCLTLLAHYNLAAKVLFLNMQLFRLPPLFFSLTLRSFSILQKFWRDSFNFSVLGTFPFSHVHIGQTALDPKSTVQILLPSWSLQSHEKDRHQTTKEINKIISKVISGMIKQKGLIKRVIVCTVDFSKRWHVSWHLNDLKGPGKQRSGGRTFQDRGNRKCKYFEGKE